MGGPALTFELRRAVLVLYSVLAFGLSAALLLLARDRGIGEFSLWAVAYLGLSLVSVRFPGAAPLAAGTMAFLLGFVRTHRGGYNLDLGLGLVALSVSLYVLAWTRRADRRVSIDLGGLSLLAIAAWSLVSVVFTIVRVRSFVPAPGFAYRSYQFNPSGFAADEAVVRALIGGTSAFVWFGLYAYARAARLPRQALNATVFLALLANTAALLVQRYVDPGFLHPVGFPLIGRLNGVTSFCYALGDAALAIYLLLPAWGARRGLLALTTAGSLGMLVYAAMASGSRTALFTMLLATVAWVGLRAVRLARERRRLAASGLAAAVVLLVGLAGAAYRLTPASQDTPLARLKDGIEREGLVGHLVAQRLASYPLTFRVMREYLLSGVGAGLYLAEVSKQHALLTPDLEMPDPYLLISFAPNQFLNVGVELGVPAMLALLVVLVHAAAAPLRSRGQSGDAVVGVLALAGALQLGPAFYNSEALAFLWLVVGLAARGGSGPEGDVEAPASPRTAGSRVSGSLLAGALLLGVGGHLISFPSLAVEHQWERLRWRLGMGMLPVEAGGRWSRPEATFSVDTNASAVSVRWHAGDEASPDYRARVAFYVDGVLAEESLARSGAIRETLLPLPATAGFKRVSVRVSPPFIPALASGGEDRRSLGIFVHSVTPVAGRAVGVPSP